VRWVVVVTELPAPRRRRDHSVVAVTRVTVIDADALFDDPTAADWLRRAMLGDAPLAVLRQFVAAHRVAAADPYVADADPGRALHIRLGYGSGEQVAAGEWTDMRELPVPAGAVPRRRARHRPADRLTALLSARDATLACEELTLRTRADLDAGRHREAALQLEASLQAALAELVGWLELGDLARRVSELEGFLEGVTAAAVAAREGRLDDAAVETVSAALARLEAAIRARAIYAAESG
jgi:hypothetical protein